MTAAGKKPVSQFFLLFMIFAAGITPAGAGEWSGNVSVELRVFMREPLYSGQQDANQSFAFAPEFYQQWQEGKYSIQFSPFIRADSNDDRRSHTDVRELLWLMVGEDWELRIGLGRLFWGVTESQHLVDIINQADLVEDPDAEQKLGQAMINLSVIRDWGTLDIILLPGFRQRSFPGEGGRLRPGLFVDVDQAVYESAQRDKHVDIALRWFQSIDAWDIGLSVFDGTGREPSLSPGMNVAAQSVLIPYYAQIRQWGLDVQLTTESWLWKLEAIQRDSQTDSYAAFTGGGEYTFYAIFNSALDLGVIAEYLYDSRNERATTPFENDLMIGMRLAWNNVQSSDLLIGVIADTESTALALSVEVSTRVGDSWKLTGRARGFAGLDEGDLLYPLRNDAYIQIGLARYF